MKCRECTYMNDVGDGLYGLYRCTNPNSIMYMEYTSVCCEDECDDGEYLVPQEQEGE